MSVERNFILARFDEHAGTLQALGSANVEQKVTSMEAMKKVRELADSARSIKK